MWVHCSFPPLAPLILSRFLAIMPRHSKNNCARPIFTHWEKHNTHEYGTQERRLTHDSQKPFESCSLCLQSAIVPLADPQGNTHRSH